MLGHLSRTITSPRAHYSTTPHMLNSAEAYNTEVCTVTLPERKSSSFFVLIWLLLHTELPSLQLTAIKHDKVVNIPTSVCV